VRRILALLVLSALGLSLLPAIAGAQVPTLPPTPERDQWYAENDSGHFTDGTRVRVDEGCLDLPAAEQLDCSLEAFRSKPFVVIAFVDSGINPYHQDFRAPDFVHHPSAFIEGYPTDAQAVPLSLDVADDEGYHAARELDDGLLLELRRNNLYWFPGTRIIGGYSTAAGSSTIGLPDRPVIDENGHGTGVASVAAGQFFGSNPNALIVAVEGLGDASLTWATSQPWIDIVSNSWGNLGNLPLGQTAATRAATERGQTVAFAAGNGATNTNSFTVFDPLPIDDPCKCKTPDSNPSFTSPYGGAPWVLTVGAVSPINGQAHWWHSIPVDVSSFGSKWRAASVAGVHREDNRDFGGTSCATPITAGVLSAVILRAREELGDTVGGQRPGQAVAVAAEGVALPASGPLADGILTREEAEQLVVRNAYPVDFDPQRLAWDYAVRPTTPAYYVYQGYGVVDRDAKQRALDTLMGEQDLPERADVDQWLGAVDTVRGALWGR
jgi:hypothetical protein